MKAVQEEMLSFDVLQAAMADHLETTHLDEPGDPTADDGNPDDGGSVEGPAYPDRARKGPVKPSTLEV
jgi:hypothetical protein